MPRFSRLISVIALVCTASAALAHGGTYQPPPDPPPKPPYKPPRDTSGQIPPGSREPSDPPPPSEQPPATPPTIPSDSPKPPVTPGGDADPPTTPGGDVNPPTTPPSTTPPAGGPGADPSTGGTGVPFGPVTGSRPAATASAPSADHWSRWWYANRAFLVDLDARAARGVALTPGSHEAGDDTLWRAELVQALARTVDDDDEDIASGAIIALGKSGDSSQADTLARVLLDSRRRQSVRESAALALGLLPATGDETESTRQALEEVARSDDEAPRLRGCAVYGLGMRGEITSLPFLVETVRTRDGGWDVPAAGLTALGLSRQPMVRADLESALESDRRGRQRESILRVYAAHGLSAMGDPKAIPALREAAEDKDENVRRAAVLALGALSNEADDATVELLARLLVRDRDRATRNMAALSLARTGHARVEALLRRDYDKGDSQHKPFAALALGLLARRNGSPDMVKPLVRDFEERANADLRGALALAIGLGRCEAGAPALRNVVSARGDAELRAHAALALGLMGDRFGGPAVLRPLLADAKDDVLRREAALALGLIGDREAVRLLVDTVENGNTVFVRGSAAMALGRIGGREAGDALTALLADTKRPAIGRAMAAVGIGMLLDRNAGRGLARIGTDLNWYLQTDSVAEVLTIL